MKRTLLVVAAGVIALHLGLYLAFGLPAALISAGLLLIAGGLLIDLENNE